MRTQKKYIKQFAPVLQKAWGYTPRAVDADMAHTLAAGGGQFGNPKVFKVGRKNVAFFPTFQGGSVTVRKNSVTHRTPYGTYTYKKGASTDAVFVPEKLGAKLRMKPGQSLFMRGDMLGDGTHYGEDRTELETLLGDHERELETASMLTPNISFDEYAKKATANQEFLARMKKSLVFGVHTPNKKPVSRQVSDALSAKTKAANKAWKL
mgnify:FL=1